MKARLPLLPLLLLLSLPLTLGAACGGGDDSGGGSAAADGGSGGGGGGGGGALLGQGEGPCESADECAGGVCVAIIDGDNPPNYCTQECGSCPSGFYCDSETFGLAGLSFCRFGDTPSQEPPAEPPRLPCKSDDECDNGLVCATFMGESECTLPCTGEEQCTVDLGGFVVDLHTCDADQGDAGGRTVCLPDLDCYPDATSCIGLPDF